MEASPEKKSAPTPEKNKAETGSETVVFQERLLHYEPGLVLTKDNNPLRREDGSFRDHKEIRILFQNVFEQKVGIQNKAVQRHVFRYYLNQLFNTMATAARNKQTAPEELRAAEQNLIGEMAGIIRNPEQYGISDEYQDKSRKELQYDLDSEGNHDDFAKLEALLQDSDNVPDPFYISGRLPTPEVIADACKRLYEKWYPENEDEQHTARLLIKQKCIDQVIRELQQTEYDKERTFFEREQAIDAKVQTVTTLMRQLSEEEYMYHYVNMAAFGPYTTATDYPDDIIPLASFYKRPPYNLDAGMEDGPEKTIQRVSFYRTIYERMGATEKAEMVDLFDNQSNAFFRDEAGPISPAHAYAKIEMVLRQKGFSDDEINGSCAGHIADIVDEMARFERRFKQLHTQRSQVKEVDELSLINKSIAEMKNSGRGELRKKMLTKAKQIADNKELLALLPVEPEQDLLTVLADTEIATYDKESSEQSPFAFDYGVLNDVDARVVEGERFTESVHEYLQDFYNSPGANSAAKNDSFIEKRDAIQTALSTLQTALEDTVSVVESDIRSLVTKISNDSADVIEIINKAASVDDLTKVE